MKIEYLHGGPEFSSTDYLAPSFIAFFVFFFVFLLTSVSFLRERMRGTMVRLLASPITRAETILGYMLGFSIFALVQSSLVLLFVIYVLKVHYLGNISIVLLVELILTVGAVNLGIFASTFAKNELQVVQFMPLMIVPQVLLSGMLIPLETMPPILQKLSYAIPLMYANTAMKAVMVKGYNLSQVWPELMVLAGFAILLTVGSAAALRRQTD